MNYLMKTGGEENKRPKKHTFSTSKNTFVHVNPSPYTPIRTRLTAHHRDSEDVREPWVLLNCLSRVPSVVLAQRRVVDGLHAYKHRHVHTDEASPPCRHSGGRDVNLPIEVGAGFHWPAISGTVLVRVSTSAAITSILESLVLVVIGFLPVFRFRESRGFGWEVVYDSRAFVQEGFE